MSSQSENQSRVKPGVEVLEGRELPSARLASSLWYRSTPYQPAAQVRYLSPQVYSAGTAATGTTVNILAAILFPVF